jgi:hypothetical protein
MGNCIAHIYVVEFQKRGLPHAHILLFFSKLHKMRGPQDYDGLVCCELPDPEKEPELYAAVTKCMIHGPCGATWAFSFVPINSRLFNSLLMFLHRLNFMCYLLVWIVSEVAFLRQSECPVYEGRALHQGVPEGMVRRDQGG